MKKFFAAAMIFVLLLTAASCGGASETAYELTDGQELTVENQTFDGDVVINGVGGQIVFTGCTFKGDVINNGTLGTRVFILGSTLDGRCVIKNDIKEGTIETPLPKFLADIPYQAVCEDCIGNFMVIGDHVLTLNGEEYTMAGSELFYDGNAPEAGFVPYEGQQADLFYVGQWWENGEKVMFLACESEPST